MNHVVLYRLILAAIATVFVVTPFVTYGAIQDLYFAGTLQAAGGTDPKDTLVMTLFVLAAAAVFWYGYMLKLEYQLAIRGNRSAYWRNDTRNDWQQYRRRNDKPMCDYKKQLLKVLKKSERKRTGCYWFLNMMTTSDYQKDIDLSNVDIRMPVRHVLDKLEARAPATT